MIETSRVGDARAGKDSTYLSQMKIWMILLTSQSQENPGLLIDGASETVKHQIKKKEGGLLPGMMAPMADSLIQPVASSLTNAITGKTVRRSGKEQEGGFLPLLALPLTMKVLRKEVTRTGKGYNNMDHMDQNV